MLVNTPALLPTEMLSKDEKPVEKHADKKSLQSFNSVYDESRSSKNVERDEETDRDDKQVIAADVVDNEIPDVGKNLGNTEDALSGAEFDHDVSLTDEPEANGDDLAGHLMAAAEVHDTVSKHTLDPLEEAGGSALGAGLPETVPEDGSEFDLSDPAGADEPSGTDLDDRGAQVVANAVQPRMEDSETVVDAKVGRDGKGAEEELAASQARHKLETAEETERLSADPEADVEKQLQRASGVPSTTTLVSGETPSKSAAVSTGAGEQEAKNTSQAQLDLQQKPNADETQRDPLADPTTRATEAGDKNWSAAETSQRNEVQRRVSKVFDVRTSASVQPLPSVAETALAVSEASSLSDTNLLRDEGFLQKGQPDMVALPQLLTEATLRSGAVTFRAETPRMVAQQMAEAVVSSDKTRVDLALSPKELGNVNMRLSTTDTGVVLTIQAERPETEDLMRRHIDDLAREFREMGFTDVTFEFGSSGGGESDAHGSEGHDGLALDEQVDQVDENVGIAPPLSTGAQGLDIRI